LRKMICLSADDSTVGSVALYGGSHFLGHARLAIVVDDRIAPRGVAAAACIGCITEAFGTWGLRRLYFEVADHTLSTLVSAFDRACQPRGSLLEYLDTGSGYEDVHYFALDSEAWLQAIHTLPALEVMATPLRRSTRVRRTTAHLEQPHNEESVTDQTSELVPPWPRTSVASDAAVGPGLDEP